MAAGAPLHYAFVPRMAFSEMCDRFVPSIRRGQDEPDLVFDTAAGIDSSTPHTDLTKHHRSSDYNGVVSAALLALLFFQQSAAVADDPHQSALAAYRQHRYTNAAELFEKAVAAETKDSRAERESVLLLAQSYYPPGKIREALPSLERAAQSRLNTIAVTYMLGNAYIQTRQADKAVTAFATMFSFATNCAAAHLPAAQFMIHQEFEEDARKELAKALDLPQLQRGELANAEGMLRRALAIDPNNSSDRYFLGQTLIEAGREDAGRQMRGRPAFPGPAAPVEI
jgi:predicted Zn-dependent protease